MSDLKLLTPFLFKWEAGYQCLKEDKANYNSQGVLIGTKYGVTPLTYEKYFKKVPTKSDIQNLTPEQASFIMEKYWNRWKASEIKSQKVANTLVDWVYLSGNWGVTIPQELIGVKPDGIVGSITINALNETIDKDEKKFLEQLYKARLDYINNIIKSKPILKKFEKGWKNRLEDLKLYNKTL